MRGKATVLCRICYAAKRMKKKLFILFGVVLIFSGLFFLFGSRVLGVFFPKKEYVLTRSESSVHRFRDSSTRLDAIRVKVFYAVPRNRTGDIPNDWKTPIEEALRRAVSFHSLQFRGKSSLAFDVYPKPVILDEESHFYNTDITARGNPHALISVAEELDRRVFQPDGDLYDAGFSAFKKGEYPVFGIIYEGVGASGGIIQDSPKQSAGEVARELKLPEFLIFKVHVPSANGFFILSRDFLTDAEYRVNSATLLYHEFSHTMAIPDGNDLDNGASYTADIIGDGRRKPLLRTYLSRDILSGMGLVE